MGSIINELQDLTYLEWSKIRNSSGTAGSFLKASSELDGKKIYYKLSDYDSVNGIVGHECVNEIISDRLLTVLGIEHLSYDLIHARISVDGRVTETYLCASADFKQRGESKLALDAYYELERSAGETPLEFCINRGWEDYIYKMLAADYLILNRDRHGANIEVLYNSKNKSVRLAPLFDNGLSLLCRCRTESEIEKFDVLDDKPVQCFVGSKSAYDNLNLIPADKIPVLSPLRESDREFIFKDLKNTAPDILLEKCWKMIWKRWCEYESFCNKKRI